MEPTWHDGLSRKALVELVEALLLAMDKSVPRLDPMRAALDFKDEAFGVTPSRANFFRDGICEKAQRVVAIARGVGEDLPTLLGTCHGVTISIF